MTIDNWSYLCNIGIRSFRVRIYIYELGALLHLLHLFKVILSSISTFITVA